MNILDFSNNRTIEFKFKNKTGKLCNYDFTITAEHLEKLNVLVEDQQKEIKKVAQKHITIKNEKDLDLSEVVKHVDLNGEEKIKKEYIKIILENKYDEYLEDTKNIENLVNTALYEILLQETENLKKLISGEEEKN